VNFDLVFEVCIKLLSCSRPPSISNHFIYVTPSSTRQQPMDNGLLFHMTQPTNTSTTRSHCT